MTVYVQRDENGTIKGVYLRRQEGYAEEELSADHPEVLAFEAMVEAALNPSA